MMCGTTGKATVVDGCKLVNVVHGRNIYVEEKREKVLFS